MGYLGRSGYFYLWLFRSIVVGLGIRVGGGGAEVGFGVCDI